MFCKYLNRKHHAKTFLSVLLILFGILGVAHSIYAVWQWIELLRGGKEGTHYVTDYANHNAIRARQRLSLPQTPEVRVKMEISSGRLTPPTKVEPNFNMPGGGLERTATGDIQVKIIQVQ